MLLFMFLLLPVVLAGYCFYRKDSKMIPSIFIGLMSAVLVCLFRTFFLYAHRVIPYSLGSNIGYLLIRQTLLPVLILYGIFIAVSKDGLEYKGKAVFPLLTSFYMVYLPYSIITTSEGLYSGFSIFVKPLLFAFMILFVSFCAIRIVKAIEDKKIIFIILYSVAALLYLFMPVLIESYSIINENMVLQVILSIVYCLVPAGIQTVLILKK